MCLDSLPFSADYLRFVLTARALMTLSPSACCYRHSLAELRDGSLADISMLVLKQEMSKMRRAGIISLLAFGVGTLVLVVGTDFVALRQYYGCACLQNLCSAAACILCISWLRTVRVLA